MYVDDMTRMRHMRDAARDALSFARGRARSELDDDRILVHALVRCLEIIGDAAGRVTAERRERTPAIPWADIIGMRHCIVQEYFRVDLDSVWSIVIDDLPASLAAIEASLPAE